MIVTLEIPVKEGTAQRAADLVERSLATAREWEGCRAIEVGFSVEPDLVFVFEHWASDEAAERYRAWRRETGAVDVLVDNGLRIDELRRRAFNPRERAPGGSREPRAVVESFLASLGTGDTDEIVGHMAHDATYRVVGAREGLGGELSKAEFAEMHRAGADMYVDRGLEVTPTGWTVDGDRVAVEATGLGVLAKGGSYANEYHYLFVVRDGLIVRVSEYTDTDHIVSLLLP